MPSGRLCSGFSCSLPPAPCSLKIPPPASPFTSSGAPVVTAMAGPATARQRRTCSRARATSRAGSTRSARRRAASFRPTRISSGRSTTACRAARCPGGRGGSLRPSGGTSVAALKVGRQFYDSIGCRKCHGDQGRGDGPSAPTLKDDADFPIFAADLHQSWRFRGGGSVEDIYRRLRTGLDGTPMPSFADLIDQKFLTDEELWRLAQYVRSLSPAPPEVRDVVHAPQVPGTVPVSWFPLEGQVIHKSRWFAPAVAGVWVQALHDGKTLALRVSWDDRTESPDTAWLKFEQRILETVAGDDSAPGPKAEPWPDQLAVQFPRHLPPGMERPYFLMGATTDPVYQWRWTSRPRRAFAGLARGIERFDTLPGAPAGEATYEHGEWRLVLTRALATPDTANEVQLEAGRAIPMAFFAWDGSSGEHGSRMAVSTWYFLALDRPTAAGPSAGK